MYKILTMVAQNCKNKIIKNCKESRACSLRHKTAELNWTELNWTELNWTDLNWTELIWTELNWTELKWIVICESKSIVKSWNELNWTGLNWTELIWIELNWIELNWIELKISWREQAPSIYYLQQAKGKEERLCKYRRLNYHTELLTTKHKRARKL